MVQYLRFMDECSGFRVYVLVFMVSGFGDTFHGIGVLFLRFMV
jgi:hypothetical protein